MTRGGIPWEVGALASLRPGRNHGQCSRWTIWPAVPPRQLCVRPNWCWKQLGSWILANGRMFRYILLMFEKVLLTWYFARYNGYAVSNGTSNFKTTVFPLTDFTSVSFTFISPCQLHQKKSQNHVRHLLIQIMRAHRPEEDLTHFYEIRYLTTNIPQQDHIIVFAPRMRALRILATIVFV